MKNLDKFIDQIEVNLTNNHVKLLIKIIKIQQKELNNIAEITDLSIPNLLNVISMAKDTSLAIEKILEKK